MCARHIVPTLIICAVMQCAAAVEFVPSMARAEHSVTTSVILYCGNMAYNGEDSVKSAYCLNYTADCVCLAASGTMMLSSSALDATVRLVYWPLFGTHLNVGAGAVAHYRAYEDIFTETDVLLGGWGRWRGKYFESNANVDWMIKSGRIHAIEHYVPHLVNKSMAVALECKWHIPPLRISVWGALSSWSDTSFMLFFAPRWTAGIEWEALPHKSIGVEATAVYIDQATLSSYCAGTEVRLFVKLTS